MTQHTKGPWSFRQSEKDFIVYGDDDVYRVAIVIDFNRFPQNAANARLIAAAPDLLRALRLLLAVTQDDGTGAQREVVAQCNAVIAKAEGKE